jgi:hypothetical protein
MGVAASSLYDPRHIRIWGHLCALSSVQSRIQMLDTLFSGVEYVNAAKRAGIYSSLLSWMAATRRGEYAVWPDPTTAYTAPSIPDRFVPQPQLRPQNEIHHQATAPPQRTQQLAVIPPPKRALDVLHESYRILGIDDTKPLSHEGLRLSYKRAAVRAHPDKGGSAEQFDTVTRAFLYLEEVLDKLIPKSAKDSTDARFTAAVTPETALRARGVVSTAAAPPGTLRIEDRDAPPIALNPKKLDMTVFNKLFEENKLPDPDKDDGYGDWLKSQDARSAPSSDMRGKYNKDVFNKMFEDEARRQTGAAASALSAYKPPSDLVMAPGFGTELGADRPQTYTKAVNGHGIGYTDLKHAYTEEATFSQHIAGLTTDGRPKTLEEAKREYGSSPQAMTADQAAAVAAFERAKAAAEMQRQTRMAARDVDAAAYHDRLKNRLLIS